MKSGTRVIIAGAGIVGLCSAWYARKRGLKVTVIERGQAERGGCSFGNAGMVVPSHFIPLAAPGMVAQGLKWMANPESPFYVKPRLSWDLLAWGARFWLAATSKHVRRAAPLLRDLSLASRALFEELEPLGFGLEKRGLLMLCKTAHALDDEAKTAATARSLGVPADVLDAAQTAALDPAVRMDIAGSVYFPKDCQLDPARLMAALQGELQKDGVEFLWNTEVEGWRFESCRIAAAVTSHGEIAGDEFVLCGGSWSQGMAEGLGLGLPMQAGKGYSLTLRQPRQLPRICSIFCEARVAVTPMGNSLRFGGTMEIAGMDESINARRVAGIVRAVPQYYPEFSTEDFAGVEPWAGLRPCSPDGLPYLGRSVAFENLTIATGHAMMGLSLGPVSGRIVAELLSGEPPSHDLTLLSPDRYS
jgi:D-amino-acid dehydrogenase